MEIELFDSLGKIAGLGGIALGVFLLLFKKLLEKIKVPGLTKAQWFKVIVIFMILVWSVAILGIGSWVTSEYFKNGNVKEGLVTDPITGRKISPISPSNLSLEKYFVGEWINIDEKTRGVTRFTLKKSSDTFFISIWGSCKPRDCAWGEVSVDVFTKDVFSDSTKDGVALSGMYDQNFAEVGITIRPSLNGRLNLETITKFKDGSGRSNFISSGEFRRK